MGNPYSGNGGNPYFNQPIGMGGNPFQLQGVPLGQAGGGGEWWKDPSLWGALLSGVGSIWGAQNQNAANDKTYQAQMAQLAALVARQAQVQGYVNQYLQPGQNQYSQMLMSMLGGAAPRGQAPAAPAGPAPVGPVPGGLPPGVMPPQGGNPQGGTYNPQDFLSQLAGLPRPGSGSGTVRPGTNGSTAVDAPVAARATASPKGIEGKDWREKLTKLTQAGGAENPFAQLSDDQWSELLQENPSYYRPLYDTVINGRLSAAGYKTLPDGSRISPQEELTRYLAQYGTNIGQRLGTGVIQPGPEFAAMLGLGGAPQGMQTGGPMIANAGGGNPALGAGMLANPGVLAQAISAMAGREDAGSQQIGDGGFGSGTGGYGPNRPPGVTYPTAVPQTPYIRDPQTGEMVPVPQGTNVGYGPWWNTGNPPAGWPAIPTSGQGQQQGAGSMPAMPNFTAPTTQSAAQWGGAPLIDLGSFAAGNQSFNSGQDALSQLLRASPERQQQAGLDTALQDLMSTGGASNLGALFDAMGKKSQLDIDQQLADIQGSVGSFGQRLGTPLLGELARAGAGAKANLGVQQQQLMLQANEAAQGRRLGASQAGVSREAAMNQFGLGAYGAQSQAAQALAGLGSGQSNMLAQLALANQGVQQQTGMANTAATNQTNQFNASQDQNWNQFMAAILGQANAMQQAQGGQNAGLLGILAGLPQGQAPVAQPSAMPGAIQDLGQLGLLWNYLR